MMVILRYQQETLYSTGLFVSHFDAGVDGTDEEDVGQDDKDADVKTKHKCCSAEEEKTQAH